MTGFQMPNVVISLFRLSRIVTHGTKYICIYFWILFFGLLYSRLTIAVVFVAVQNTYVLPSAAVSKFASASD